ncbi:MAG: hypothetical protein JSW01_02535 [Candidatus Bathyarchaeota archaeon]|nr:MAG: hypothetical protein JSW01_02535 [Candidatus Bathyarchaeota archaeon]
MAVFRRTVGEKEKQEIIKLLRKQIRTEKLCIDAYKKSVDEIQNEPVKKILRMIRLDSEKHIDILQASIDIIQGEDVLSEDKKHLKRGLRRHLELEKDSIDIANRILSEGWIKESEGLVELIKSWKNDEIRHHRLLRELSEKTYFRLNELDWIAVFRDEAFLEKRYLRSKRLKEKFED